MKNKITKKIEGEVIGFFLGTKAKAEFREATGTEMSKIFDKGNNGDFLFAHFLLACANAYETYYGEKKVYIIDDCYHWMDVVPEDDWVEFMRKIFDIPKAEEPVEGNV